MKLTKFVHSCLLVEDSRVGLIDPGQFSWESGLFDVNKLGRLDDILITHEHPDHLYLPFLQAVLAKFPDAQIYTNPSVATQLRTAGIVNVMTTGSDTVAFFATNHEPTEPVGRTPENTGFHYLGRMTTPGDSHHFDQTKEVLALPVTAPWGSVVRAAALAVALKPKYIIPIHDWHWNQKARASAYRMLEAFLGGQGITLLSPIDGQSIDL